TSAISQMNFHGEGLAWGTWTPKGNVNYALTEEIAILNAIAALTEEDEYPDYTPLIDHLNKELLAGQMSAKLRTELANYFTLSWNPTNGWWDLSNSSYIREHAAYAMGIVFASPEFCVQK